MEMPRTGFAVLRSINSWQGRRQRLAPRQDGALALARLPGLPPEAAVTLPGPYNVPPSGLAVGPCGNLFLAQDLAGPPEVAAIVALDAVCQSRRVVPGRGGPGAGPGQFNYPAGLLFSDPPGKNTPPRLYVADRGNKRIKVLRLPTLELRAIWSFGFSDPAMLAGDAQGRVYVLDLGLKRVLRFSPQGIPDTAYNAALAAQPLPANLAGLALDDAGQLYISGSAEGIHRYAPDAAALGALPALAGCMPAVLTVGGGMLFAADSASGKIWAYDLATEAWLGALPGYTGPAAALAWGNPGGLCIKPGLGLKNYFLAAGVGCAATGSLEVGPLDAGLGSHPAAGWLRLRLDAELPAPPEVPSMAPSAGIAPLQGLVYTSNDPAAPADSDYLPLPALDSLLPLQPDPHTGKPRPARFLWLRIAFTSPDGYTSSALLQAQAETGGEDYMDYLPAVYRRADAPTGFLRRYLQLTRSELGDLELELDDLARRFNPELAPAADLPWLASWLAFRLPEGIPEAETRLLLRRVYDMYRRRGTPAGLADFIQLYTGVRPLITEAFRQRHIWMLDETSLLNFDTGLAPADPAGLVIPDTPSGTCAPARSGAAASGPAPQDSVEQADPDQPWSDPPGLVVGNAVVGAAGPLDYDDFGLPLFSDTAHLFTVLVPAYRFSTPRQRQELVAVIETEKPAHTDYHLCFIEPRMRVGYQARLGIDSIVASSHDPLALDESALGLAGLDDAPGEAGVSRAGQGATLGKNLVVQ